MKLASKQRFAWLSALLLGFSLSSSSGQAAEFRQIPVSRAVDQAPDRVNDMRFASVSNDGAYATSIYYVERDDPSQPIGRVSFLWDRDADLIVEHAIRSGDEARTFNGVSPSGALVANVIEPPGPPVFDFHPGHRVGLQSPSAIFAGETVSPVAGIIGDVVALSEPAERYWMLEYGAFTTLDVVRLNADGTEDARFLELLNAANFKGVASHATLGRAAMVASGPDSEGVVVALGGTPDAPPTTPPVVWRDSGLTLLPFTDNASPRFDDDHCVARDYARATNSDLSLIAGQSACYDRDGVHGAPVLWNETETGYDWRPLSCETLPEAPDGLRRNGCSVRSMSADGRQLVGEAVQSVGDDYIAVVWDSTDLSVRSANSILADFGITDAAGWTLSSALAISADGSKMIGNGITPDHSATMWYADLSACEPGDTDRDGQVTFSDFLALTASFGDQGSWLPADFDFDGHVSFSDFLVLSMNFGSTCSESDVTFAVPEPSGLAISTTAIVLGLLMRQRK